MAALDVLKRRREPREAGAPNGSRKRQRVDHAWGRMTPFDTISFALRALRDNRMRSALTMLGVVIGVSAVVSAVAVGQGAAGSVTNSIGQLGENLLFVMATNPRVRPGQPFEMTQTLKPGDAEAILERCSETVNRVCPLVRSMALLKAGNANWRCQLNGAPPAFFLVNNYTVSRGRTLNQVDLETRSRVVVVGKTVVQNLYGNKEENCIGREILVNRGRFTIVGVMESKGTNTFGQDQDDMVTMPLTTAMYRVLNQRHLSMISIECRSPESIDLAQEQIISLLRHRHRLSPPFPENDDFNVVAQSQILQIMQTVAGVLTILLASIAAISLTVGGIGIMNIMLVSVTERTREIGIRKALGATEGNIRAQFLIESALLSLAGGITGVLIGGGISLIAARLSGWPIAPSTQSVMIAVGVSAGIGIFFGYWPAKKAAQLHPIEALRRE